MNEIKDSTYKDLRNSAVRFILFFGIISALGDIIYESARGVYGAYLYTLGASSFFVGLISGIGEFLGYILRFLSGYLSDKTKNYWILTILGYASLVAVPLMGYVSIWQMAMMFIFWERIGKGLRSPPKDTMMSYATAQVGHGKGFGIHEALDQVGAIIGPLLFAFAFTIRNDYQTGFKLMWIPYFFLLAVIAITYKKYTDPKLAFIKNEPEKEKVKKSNLQIKSPLSREFIYYSLFILFSVVGFVGYPLIAFYTNANKILTLQYIPILYAISMGVDGVFALVIGNFFDKKGFKVLFLIPMLTVIMVLLVFSNSVLLVIIGVIFWGIIMAIHETIIRAAIAQLIDPELRGRAYGIFYVVYAVSFLIANALIGYILDISIIYVLFYVIGCEIGAIIILVYLLKKFSLDKTKIL